MEEVIDKKTGAIIYKSTPEKDPLEKRVLLLERNVTELKKLVNELINNKE